MCPGSYYREERSKEEGSDESKHFNLHYYPDLDPDPFYVFLSGGPGVGKTSLVSVYLNT